MARVPRMTLGLLAVLLNCLTDDTFSEERKRAFKDEILEAYKQRLIEAGYDASR